MKHFTCPKWLLALLSFTFLLRIPSLFEPFYYGDEMIYLTLGQGIKKGLVLYKEIHDNKPPLLYFLAAISGNVFWFRALLLFWFILTVFLFWKLTRILLFKNERAQMVATIFFAILGSIPLLEGQIANAEIFMISFAILGFYFLLRRDVITTRNALISGLCFSLASLLKIPAAFDTIAVGFLLLLVLNKKNHFNIKELFKTGFSFAIGFLVPLGLSILWYVVRGAGQEYVIAAFLQNVGYLSAFHQTAQAPFLTRNGPLLFRAFLTVASLVVLFILRKKLPRTYLIASAWLITSLFAVTLPGRPYPHYFIQIVPAVSILIGMLVFEKTVAQVYTVIPLALPLFVAVYFKFWQYPTLPYYQNFVSFATKSISQKAYMNHFSKETSRNYEIAKQIKLLTKPTDRIFVWYDGAPIYALSDRLPIGKYTAGYHIDDFVGREAFLAELSSKQPKIIVVLPNAPDLPGMSKLLLTNYLQYQNIDGALIYKQRAL